MKMLTCLTALLLSTLFHTAAAAQAPRTFVSIQGKDRNTCPVTAPCRTFTAALAAVANGGEVVVLDSGGYEPFTIAKSATIIAPLGIYAVITGAPGDVAIRVNASAQSVVVLRGLSLEGLRTSNVGVFFQAGYQLFLDDININGFVIAGVFAQQTGSAVFVDRTRVRNSVHDGMRLELVTGSPILALFASVANSQFDGNGGCGLVTSGARMSVVNTRAVGNGTGACATLEGDLSLQGMTIMNSNFEGVICSDDATVRIASSTVTLNFRGLNNQSCSTFGSMGNNIVYGNPLGDVLGSITPISGL